MSAYLLPFDLNRLRELAKAATPGPWAIRDHGDIYSEHPAMSRAGGSCDGLRYSDGSGWQHEGDVEYIAALSPEVVLELIAGYTANRNRADGIKC